jgi:hypothetical protein
MNGVSAEDIKPGMIIRLRNCNCLHRVVAVAYPGTETNPRAIVAVTLPHDAQYFFRASDWVEVIE